MSDRAGLATRARQNIESVSGYKLFILSSHSSSQGSALISQAGDNETEISVKNKTNLCTENS